MFGKLASVGKKGAGISGIALGIVYAVIGLVVALTLYAELVPEMETAGDALNATGVPFGRFFATGGLIFTLIMVGLLILGIKMFMKK